MRFWVVIFEASFGNKGIGKLIFLNNYKFTEYLVAAKANRLTSL